LIRKLQLMQFRLLFLFSLLWLPFLVSAQSFNYSRALIHLDQNHRLEQLAVLGVDVDHGDYSEQQYFISDFSEEELRLISEAGFSYDIQIEDVSSYYVSQNTSSILTARTTSCSAPGPYDQYSIPEHYAPGSMGGYFTYQEMLDQLDSMSALYPHLITVKSPISPILTHENRPIYGVKISDNPTVDEPEPELLMNSLHHAREPNSLSQLLFFMWYLLENYEQDPHIQYLLNESELYFIPCVNPDGYIFNETNAPDGGGLWRKNRRNNQDGTYGVDLNRNYGFEWGFDDIGSSPFPNSNVYRGPAPFSEPETQAVRDFCNEHEFEISLNYHTFGEVVIYPWSYSDTPTPDSTIFFAFAEAMTRENNYRFGTISETLGYIANGSADDWMYGELSTKPPIISYTPEIGPGQFGFWPPEDQIIELNKSALLQNLTTCWLLHRYGIASDLSESYLFETEGSIPVSLKRYGLRDGPLTVSLVALSDNITSTGLPQSFDLNLAEETTFSIPYSLSTDAGFGDTVLFALQVDNGSLTFSDTLFKRFLFYPQSELWDDANTTEQWTQGADELWGLTTSEYYSPPSSFTTSPNQSYPEDTSGYFRSPLIDLSDAESAQLSFYAKWDMAIVFDYVQVQAVDADETTITPLCGKYTQAGLGGLQPEGEPLYRDEQEIWVREEICLDSFTGQQIYIQFFLFSDNNFSDDGFFFDDLEVISFDQEAIPSHQSIELVPHGKKAPFRIQPNPSTDFFYLVPTGQSPTRHPLNIRNSVGQVIRQYEWKGEKDRWEVSDWPSGLYFLELEGYPIQKLVIIR
jgi:carboxypeptidase T